jgi:hypothetical protein
MFWNLAIALKKTFELVFLVKWLRRATIAKEEPSASGF